jgi:LacI family transcriptional regulator
MSKQRTTVKDIARHAGVSPATVSLVLRKSPLVAEGTRAKIQTSISALGYVYDRAAAKLRARLTHTIGLIVCEITNPFYAELTAGIDDALDRAGWVAFLANSAESIVRQDRFIERMLEHRVDGFLIAPAEGSSSNFVERLRRQNAPVVQMLRRLEGQAGDYVGADFARGMTTALEHLIGLGHQRIAFVGAGRRSSPARDRAIAYERTLSQHGLAAGPVVDCLPTREEGVRAAAQLVRGAPGDPTAIVCHNDLCALGVMLGLSDRGIAVGRDCAVIGFDNIPEAAHHRPTLTTIEIDGRQIGEEAARLLIRRIKSPSAPPESIVIAPRLVVRSSCGGGDIETRSTISAAKLAHKKRETAGRKDHGRALPT